MAEQGGGDAGPSGRGDGPGRGTGSRKGRFMPTVPSRRKKEESGAGAGSVADAAAASDTFKDLLKAAQSEASWERGTGRGRGRGGQLLNQQQRVMVTFGGSDSKPVLAAAKQKGAGKADGGGSKSGGGGGGGYSGADGSGAGGTKNAGPGADGAQPSVPGLAPARPHGLRRKDVGDNVLDLRQYYATMLPLRPPPDQEDAYPDMVQYEDEEEDWAGGGGAQGALHQDPVATLDQVPERPAAEELRLAEAAETSRMFLVQLPSVLPVPATRVQRVQVKDEPGTSSCAAAQASVKASGAGGAASCSLKDFGGGSVGKLLVFKSGKVKMQMGDILMDVSSGTVCQHRQDAMAISYSSGDCVFLGEVAQRIVVSPDIWQLMADTPVPDWKREALPPQPAYTHEANGGMDVDGSNGLAGGPLTQPAGTSTAGKRGGATEQPTAIKQEAPGPAKADGVPDNQAPVKAEVQPLATAPQLKRLQRGAGGAGVQAEGARPVPPAQGDTRMEVDGEEQEDGAHAGEEGEEFEAERYGGQDLEDLEDE